MRARALSVLIGVAAVSVTPMPAAAQAVSTKPDAGVPKSRQVEQIERLDALARAQVWAPPAVPVSKAHLGTDSSRTAPIECKFLPTEPSGTSPKFDCTLANGAEIRVKYGNTPEIPSEVAATRLLQVLGFPADEVVLVERVRCYGCPAQPFTTMKAVELGNAAALYQRTVNYGEYKDFEWVAVERKHQGPAIATGTTKGWAFFELEKIDERRGGAPRAHVDALRLLAVFLAHWDNKSENQRLVCASDRDWPEGGDCRKPLAMLQDVGAVFGPAKVDLEAWERTPVWVDRGRCAVSLETLPHGGGTFAPVLISESGRRLLGSLLTQLSDEQLRQLFSSARFDRLKGFVPVRQHAIADWVRVFQQKVREISDGPACPR